MDKMREEFEDYVADQKDQMKLMGIRFTPELEGFLWSFWKESRAVIKVMLPEPDSYEVSRVYFNDTSTRQIKKALDEAGISYE